MIALVRIALSRPYTFVVLALLLLIMGPLAALRTPTDIFPDIRIPVIGVVWQYTGLPPDQMSGRITTPFERALTTELDLAGTFLGCGLHTAKDCLNLALDHGKLGLKHAALWMQHNIHGCGEQRQRTSHGLAQPALDSVANHRITDLAGDRQTQARVRLIRKHRQIDDEMLGLKPQARAPHT